MGLFDNIKFEMDCPKCGSRVTGFQSKDGDCLLDELEFWEVNNFYTFCRKCDVRIEFNRKKPQQPSPIEDYEMTSPSKES